MTRLRGTRTISLKLPTAPRASHGRGINPRSDRLWLSVLCRRVLHARYSNCRMAGLASGTIASGTRGGGRSDGAGLRWSGCRPLAGCSGVVGHRLPPRAAAIRDREPTRHAYALPNRVRFASWSSSLPVPLVGPRGKEQGVDPRAFNQVGTQPPGRWGNARRSTTPAPQSKPVTAASRLVAQEAPLVAFGLGLRILAAGPAVFDCSPFAGGCVSQSSIVRLAAARRLKTHLPILFSLSGHIRGHGHRLIHRQHGSSPTELARAGIIDRSRDGGDRTEHWDIRSIAIEPYRTQALRSDDENRAIATPTPRQRGVATASGR